MAEIKYWQAVNLALREELAHDDTVVLFGEDVAKPGGPFGASRGLLDEFGESRVRDTPLSEAGIVGAAVGAAMTGLRPVVEVMFFDFITLTMDQIVNQAAKVRYMSGGALSAGIVIRALCGAGRGSGPQHSQALEGWLAHVPGVQVAVPSTPADARSVLKSAIRSDDPVVVVDSSRLWMQRGEVPEAVDIEQPGTARVERRGNDVTLISWGWAMERTRKATEDLVAKGVDVDLVDLRWLMPLDREAVLASAGRTGRVVVISDAYATYGPSAEIAALLAGPGFDLLRAPVIRLSPPFAPVPFPAHLEHAFYTQTDEIVETSLALLKGSK
ncbi:alpha-ketoacid dehydrogenase subunit beta [Nocardioides sp.]|uniref:alpha-ketoacid dehydrogenase subunit beta n=1 Tax=Nocardioides sp. TaxID=35761 RepID=UPI003D0D1814